MNASEEWFPLVDVEGNVLGRERRTVCHSGTFLLHPVVHLHVFDGQGRLCLQKRSEDKDIQPGKWDTAVGGHVDFHETVDAPSDWVRVALLREASEELGITDFHPVFAFRYAFRSAVEYELVHVFYAQYEGLMHVDPVEISEVRFWEISEVMDALGKGVFTPNFEGEIQQLLAHRAAQ
jgi:isopentenyldiphosphate isomerase